MSELFTSDEALLDGLPKTGTRLLHSTTQSWQETGSAGFYVKPLMEDSESGLRTWLMKVDAGAFSPLHDHETVEQIYVIEGSFFDQDAEYQAGDYIVRAPGAKHTAGSRDGALVLLFYSKR